MVTSDLAAQQVVSDDSRRASSEPSFLPGVGPAGRFPEPRTSRPDLGLTDDDTNSDTDGLARTDADFLMPSVATTTIPATPNPTTSTTSTTTFIDDPTTTPDNVAADTTRPETTTPGQAPDPIDWDQATVGDRGLEALALVSYPWEERLPEWEIRFHEGKDGAYGYTLTQESVIDIYVREGQSKQLLAHVIAHELGHAVDVTLNSGDDRRRWQAARGIEDAPWWPDNRASDFSTGAGDFAESFAAWQVGTDSYRSRLAAPPSADQQELLAELAAG